MLTLDEARRRVAKGADVLDLVRPAWYDRVDPESLEMSLCTRCVVGQLCGVRGLGATGIYRREAQLLFALQNEGDAWIYGLELQQPDDFLHQDGRTVLFGVMGAYKLLREAWIEAIDERRARDTACREEVLHEVLV